MGSSWRAAYWIPLWGRGAKPGLYLESIPGGGGGGAQQGIKYEIKGGKTIFHVPKYMISRGMLPRKFLHFGLPEIALSGTTFLMFLVLGACYHD